MGAIAADFGSCDQDLESEVGFYLLAQPMQRFAEEFFYLAAAEADDMGVLLLEPGFVVVLVTAVMHQIEFVDEAAVLKHLERPIDGDAIQFGIFGLREPEKLFGIEVFAGTVDEFEQNLPLTSEANPFLAQRIFHVGVCHGLI